MDRLYFVDILSSLNEMGIIKTGVFGKNCISHKREHNLYALPVGAPIIELTLQCHPDVRHPVTNQTLGLNILKQLARESGLHGDTSNG